jgi:hypothetical protein
MTQSEEVEPVAAADIVLTPEEMEPFVSGYMSPEELLPFQEQIMWGVVNFLWRGNFLHNSRLGEDLYFQKTLVSAKSVIRIKVAAWLEEIGQEDEQAVADETPEFSHHASIAVERMRPKLTEPMLVWLEGHDEATHDKDNPEEQHSNDNPDDEEDVEEEILEAWEVREYLIDDLTKGIKSSFHHEIQYGNGDIYKDDSSLSASFVDSFKLSAIDEETIEDLDQSLSAGILYEECKDLAVMLKLIRTGERPAK